MSIAERVRTALPRQPSMRKISLRTKLVASVLALVFAALALISASSTYALNTFMLDRMDAQLKSFAQDAVLVINQNRRVNVFLPPDYYVAQTSVSGVGEQSYHRTQLTLEELPPLFTGIDEISEHIQEPYPVRSINGRYVWRMVVARLDNGDVLHVAQMMTGVEAVVARLIWVDFLVGVGVLLALATVGAALVRQTLVPLVQIERTAARIAAGDLTQRVPGPEEEGIEPTTELGRLSNALNAMLAQIESAFIARALSEQAARAAEQIARENADSAQRSEARAVESEQKMRQFVADASHELRTPLTTIRGFAELYRQGAVSDPEQVARLVRRIEDEASRMGLLVEDLLLLARLDRERPLTLAPVELPVLAMDAVQAAQATAPEREVNLEVRDEPEFLVANGDDARLRQVIGNLVTNALVHTPPEASVTVRLSAGAGGTAVVEVADTGPGLSPEQTERVFERFYRVDEARTRKIDREATGTGLGLAIVAAIVRAHQGSVEVVSEPGCGATFRVTLPTINPDKSFTENVQG